MVEDIATSKKKRVDNSRRPEPIRAFIEYLKQCYDPEGKEVRFETICKRNKAKCKEVLEMLDIYKKYNDVMPLAPIRHRHE